MIMFAMIYEDFYFKMYSAAEKTNVICTYKLHIYIEKHYQIECFKNILFQLGCKSTNSF